MLTKRYDTFLIEELGDPELAAAYLSAAIEDGAVAQLLIALRGVAALADKTKLNRQAMDKLLSADGYPTLTTLLAILHAVGLNLTFAPLPEPASTNYFRARECIARLVGV